MSQAVDDGIRYDALVEDTRIHVSLYTDPRIFGEEMERIFYRGWVFVGHESEIPRPGDFVTRPVGTQPVILVRGRDGQVSVLLNRCAHRGTMVCPASRGSARVFACPYHGWTYDLGGSCWGPRTPGPGTATSTSVITACRGPRTCRATGASSSPASARTA